MNKKNTILRIENSLKDKKELSNINYDKKEILNKSQNFKNLIVKKPWGHEYLFFSSPEVSVWILKILKNHKTSMHCHTNKKTSLILVEGKANLYSLNGKIKIESGDVVAIDKGAFHRTSAEFEHDITVIEIETPTNKYDIVRYQDDYQRSSSGYEKEKFYTKVEKKDFNLTYESINSSPKILGECEIKIIDINQIDELDPNSLISPLKIKKFNKNFNIMAGEVYEKNFLLSQKSMLTNFQEFLVINKK
tara:strand:+ start:4592 stop:5335 length:744 start_codon:yes stop_codon:yes gene_type:complete